MLKALLLAGGLGMRLRPLTVTTPKCLVSVGGTPLLDYWVEALLQAGVAEAVINTHHLALAVRSAIERINAITPLHLSESFEPVLLGSGGTVANNRPLAASASAIFVIYTDNLSDIALTDLLDFHSTHTLGITMLLFRSSEPSACGIVELTSDGTIVGFEEKPPAPKSDLANAGVYVMSPEAFKAIAELDAFDLARDVLPRYVGRMKGYVHGGYHRDIGTVQAWSQACTDVSAGAFIRRTRAA